MGRTVKVQSNPKVGVAYIRVSTDEQNLGPEAQRESIQKWASQNGILIAAWFEELGVSGGAELEKRPGLLSALDALQANGAGVLVVAKRDRLARDTMLAAMIERLAERSGAVVRSADNVGNGEGPEQQLLRGIIDVFAMYERALIRARTKAALAVKASRLERVGSIGYGWRLIQDGTHLEPDENEQKIILLAHDLRSQGLPLRGIARRLEEQGLFGRNGGAWNVKSIASLLKAKVA